MLLNPSAQRFSGTSHRGLAVAFWALSPGAAVDAPRAAVPDNTLSPTHCRQSQAERTGAACGLAAHALAVGREAGTI